MRALTNDNTTRQRDLVNKAPNRVLHSALGDCRPGRITGLKVLELYLVSSSMGVTPLLLGFALLQ